MSDEKKEAKVIIIGAGIAGISAANKLKDEGITEVIILEARDRIGGRIYTLDTKIDGFLVDLGATWIHGIKGKKDGKASYNPIMNIVLENGIPYFKTLFSDSNYKQSRKNSAVYDADKRIWLSKDEIKENIKLVEEFDNLVHSEAVKIGNKSTDKTILDLFDSFCVSHQPEIKKDSNEYYTFKYHAWLAYNSEYGANLDKLSILAQEPYYKSDIAGDNVAFQSGYSQVVDVLAKKIENDIPIHLKKTVKTIDSRDTKEIKIMTDDGAEYTCDYLINTMPLGVLKSDQVTFEPPLSEKKQQAINNLEMGIFEKVYLIYEECFWEKNKSNEALGYYSKDGSKNEKNLDYFNIYKYSEYFKQPALLVFSSGSYASELNKKSDEEKLAIITSQLQEMYPVKKIPKPLKMIVSNWENDKYSKGSFLAIPKGASLKDLYQMMESEADGRIFFAGEHCSDDRYATADGALVSGKNAAKEVINVMVKERNIFISEKHEIAKVPMLFNTSNQHQVISSHALTN